MTTTTERVREVVEPLVRDLGADVYDVEHTGGVLRILLQRAEGLDMELLTAATRAISAELDAQDPMPGPYTLEVSSPGLERPLRSEAHYAGAVGEQVKIKLRPGVEGDRRLEGELVASGAGTATVRTADGERTVRLDDVERARTHVEWAPPPKPGGPKGAKQAGAKQAGAGRSAPTSGAKKSKKQQRPTGSSTPRNEATP